VPAVVERPGAADVEPRVRGLGEDGCHHGQRGAVGGEVHEPVGVEAVDDEGALRRPQVGAPARRSTIAHSSAASDDMTEETRR
jgi:hypothetical protein